MADRRYSFELNTKELNYVHQALVERLRELEQSTIRDAGNVPHLRRYTRKLLHKIDDIRGWPKSMRLAYRFGPRPRVRRESRRGREKP